MDDSQATAPAATELKPAEDSIRKPSNGIHKENCDGESVANGGEFRDNGELCGSDVL